MGLVAEPWVPSGHDHRGACRAVGSGCAKSRQEFPCPGKVQIADCGVFNSHGNGIGPPCVGRLRDEQCRTAIVGVIGAVAKHTLKLGPLLSVTCNIKPELAVPDHDRTAGRSLPVRKQPKRDYSHDENLLGNLVPDAENRTVAL
jgi:hypothetical protein